MKKAVLIDVSAIMYRAFFANINFRTKTEPTGAVYGFANTLFSIIDEFNPNYMAAAFDVKRSSLERTKMFSEYKSQRESAPEDLIKQIPRIEELLDCFNIDRYKIDGYEADDVLGTLANKLSNDGYDVTIVTGDKDLAQLVTKNISVALLGKGEAKEKFGILRNDEDVKKFIGVTADRICDLFGLIGDKSDGIPGVRKVGSKKALAILEVYKNLEEIYENVEKLSEIDGIGKGLVNNIIEDKEIAFKSRELATIQKKLSISYELKERNYSIKNGDVNIKKLLNLFNQLEFRNFIKKIEQYNVSNEKKIENNNLTLFNLETGSEVDLSVETYNFLDTKEKLTILKEELEIAKEFCIYFEKVGLGIYLNEKCYYIPLFHKNVTINNLAVEDVAKIFEFIEIGAISYNFKEILNLGINIKNMKLDTMIGYHLVTGRTNVEAVLPINDYLGKDLLELKDKFHRQDIYTIDLDEVAKYILSKTKGIMKVYPEINKKLSELKLLDIYQNVESKLIKVLHSMEKDGIKIDLQYFEKYSRELELKLKELEEKIYDEAGEIFNINSPKQLSSILFEKLNLPVIKKNKTGYSTDVEVLEQLEKRNCTIAKFLLEHRKLNKLKTTYVDALPKLVDENQKIHTTFNQIGTVTGRLSSTEPNLQNIPVKTDEGIKIREGFISSDGYVFMGIDYSQIELRVLASLSQDKKLIEAYKEKLDLHELTARKIFNLSECEKVSRQQRIIAKIVNFSIIYGKTSFGLAKELDISVKEATSYINKYFEEYVSIAPFEKSIVEFAEENGYVKTLLGRKRYIEGINSKNKNIKSQAERMAVNTVIQGTAAEIIKKSMINIYDKINGESDIKMLLQVHDELIFEVKKDSVEKYKKMIGDIMINSVELKNVNLDINVNIGTKWSETK